LPTENELPKGVLGLEVHMSFEIFATHVHYLLAGNPSAHAEMLEKLSKSSDSRVRARVAEHPMTPIRVLLALVSDRSPEVRESVSYNPAVTSVLLHQLANDSSEDVRYAIAENLAIPHAILTKLANDENPYVAQRALKTLSRLEVGSAALQAA